MGVTKETLKIKLNFEFDFEYYGERMSEFDIEKIKESLLYGEIGEVVFNNCEHMSEYPDDCDLIDIKKEVELEHS